MTVPGSFPVLNPNSATGFLDLSMVYGNSLSTQYSLRKPGYLAALDFSLSPVNGDPDFSGQQMFLPLTSQIQGNLSMPPPPDPNNFTRFVPTAMHPQVSNLFSAGDVRFHSTFSCVIKSFTRRLFHVMSQSHSRPTLSFSFCSSCDVKEIKERAFLPWEREGGISELLFQRCVLSGCMVFQRGVGWEVEGGMA